jgi:GMP reductase
MKFDLNDVLIVPETLSDISSRYRDVRIYTDDSVLPIIAAPMDTVIDKKNMPMFLRESVPFCIPRTLKNKNVKQVDNFLAYKSYSLDEFIDVCGTLITDRYILIDIANGHMKKLYRSLDKFKDSLLSGRINIMIGNIANPSTYKYICENYSWVKAVRIGIGNGNGCLTTQQTGIGYPMGSLITECRKIKNECGGPEIVADGGMKSYSDIIKALALGADYVMLGSILNKCLESAGETRLLGIKINQHGNFAKMAFKMGLPIYKVFRGMSTKPVQIAMGAKVKTSEGIVTRRKVEYTLEGWLDNFKHYLSSAMSYTNSKTLNEFIGNVEYVLVTEASVSRYRK